MSTWEGFAVECKFGSFPVLASDVQRTVTPRLASFDTPGMDASITSYHGRKGYEDRVTALIPVGDYRAFEALVTTDLPQLWQHPVMAPFVGRIHDLSVPATSQTLGMFLVSFTVREHREPGKRTVTPSSSASGAKAAAQAKWDALGDAVDDLPDWDDIDVTGGLSDAWDDLGSAWDDLSDAFDDVISGGGILSDIVSAVDSFASIGEDFIDVVRDFEDEIGSLARDIEAAPLLIAQTVRDTVNELKASASRTARVLVTDTTDLFSVMSGLSVSPERVDAVMRDNGIFDPFAVVAGTWLEVPV